MCGIAGMISPGKAVRGSVQQMISCISHRGPDGDGVWENETGTVILGHRRLAIIDLSQAAAQPMHYLDRYVIVHNGEIYNYKELRSELQAAGYHFRSASDTEVILASYDHWKESCLQRFDGMFSLAIWDEKEQRLFAARDRFGEKPFYFHFDHTNATLQFASEIKSLINNGVNRDYNGNMLLQYLSTGTSWNSDALQTFYKNVFKLPARHYLRFLPFDTNPVLEIQPYYDIDKSAKVDLDAGKAVEEFKKLFFLSVERRLRSDVEIGTSLSGGLDSSSIVAAIHRLKQPGTVHKAFTASFPGFEKDETAQAAIVAKQFSLRHFTVSPTSIELADDLGRFLSLHDEPVSSASVYAQYKVYELARQQGVKVVLDGQGADEILAGYHRHIHWYLQELYRENKMQLLHEAVTALAQHGNPFRFGWKNKLASRFPAWTAVRLEKKAFHQQKNQPGLNKEFIDAHLDRHAVNKPIVKGLNDLLYHDVFGGRLEELLRNADRNAMTHGTEVRLPFLNHNLVEFVFALPTAFKFHKGYSKYILRQGMEELLPPPIVWRKDKTGFEPPQKQWMRDSPVQDKIHEAKQLLVRENILSPAVLNQPVQPVGSHEGDNYDWRYLSAASMF
ncbi:MAG: asnB [Chitinophagaceae bacterium]|jgi:asparagine synthase (glutamine-hydrolysing)|nr:asnB [Chitinophagaceae bacterium]